MENCARGPAHKSSLRSKIENYRQISILSCLGKVLDSLMCNRLTRALGHVISDQQHGFLQRKSTTTNLVEYISTIINIKKKGYSVDAIYLDFSRAFDCLHHELLV